MNPGRRLPPRIPRSCSGQRRYSAISHTDSVILICEPPHTVIGGNDAITVQAGPPGPRIRYNGVSSLDQGARRHFEENADQQAGTGPCGVGGQQAFRSAQQVSARPQARAGPALDCSHDATNMAKALRVAVGDSGCAFPCRLLRPGHFQHGLRCCRISDLDDLASVRWGLRDEPRPGSEPRTLVRPKPPRISHSRPSSTAAFAAAAFGQSPAGGPPCRRKCPARQGAGLRAWLSGAVDLRRCTSGPRRRKECSRFESDHVWGCRLVGHDHHNNGGVRGPLPGDSAGPVCSRWPHDRRRRSPGRCYGFCRFLDGAVGRGRNRSGNRLRGRADPRGTPPALGTG